MPASHLRCRSNAVNVVHPYVPRLIAVGALALIVPTLASASNVEQPTNFKLAMGPMSAAQKSQGPGMAEQSGAAEMKPDHRIKKHHHHVKHRSPHHG
jgi:hypothetical protein